MTFHVPGYQSCFLIFASSGEWSLLIEKYLQKINFNAESTYKSHNLLHLYHTTKHYQEFFFSFTQPFLSIHSIHKSIFISFHHSFHSHQTIMKNTLQDPYVCHKLLRRCWLRFARFNMFPFTKQLIASLWTPEWITNNQSNWFIIVYVQSQVRMPNGSGVRWAECLLIIGTGCRVQVL